MSTIELASPVVGAVSPAAAALDTFENDVVVYIGRFQPFHNGHSVVLKRALAQGKKVVVVLGSAFRARDPKNPMTWDERRDMILLTLSEDEQSRTVFVPMRDYYDDAVWVKKTIEAVTAVVPEARRVALIGHFKDASSYYLNRFPKWKLLEEPRHTEIDATMVRRVLLETPDQPRDGVFSVIRPLVPTGVYNYLSASWSLPHWARLGKEALWLVDYRRKYTASHYLAADGIVLCNKRVLLIKRGRGQGKGLYALPGGFVEKNERFYDAAIRELKEETGFSMFGDGLRAHLVKSHVFDDPNRSLRAHIVSHMFVFDLGERSAQPDVQAKDDAEPHSAEWVLLSDLKEMESEFFEDHWHALDFFGLVQ
ncbi:NUDIX domain-containing protein [Burkholderia cenocepacia]|uniref:NUDIX domain-containing protein n=1 Tax=Burkholderia cenocepacia TaxID=95486 RepID=UPI00076111FA|nr:NUDIX domain-containing protein [Burkholderia cenocepacia]KWU19198.1 hypothetical protein AS149_13205 [Burkholderia cenocepacia]